MCSIPPAPPPPPPHSLNLSPLLNLQKKEITSSLEQPEVCKWASANPQLQEACAKSNMCTHEAPFKYNYKHFASILQIGPTCGLVALSMLVNGEVSFTEMLNITRIEGYSNNGEMFSCKNMAKLSEKVLSLAEIENVKYSLKKDGLFSHDTVEKLLDGAVLLVPYDADFNHSPCLKNGHKAHWALICGVIVVRDPGNSYDSIPDNIYVLCKHGKSRYLAVWRLDELNRSNKNLHELSPMRSEDGSIYILPEGGIEGENGLRGQFLMFHGL